MLVVRNNRTYKCSILTHRVIGQLYAGKDPCPAQMNCHTNVHNPLKYGFIGIEDRSKHHNNYLVNGSEISGIRRYPNIYYHSRRISTVTVAQAVCLLTVLQAICMLTNRCPGYSEARMEVSITLPMSVIVNFNHLVSIECVILYLGTKFVKKIIKLPVYLHARGSYPQKARIKIVT